MWDGYYQSPDASFPGRTWSTAADDTALRFIVGITVRLEYVVVAVFTLYSSIAQATPTRRRTLHTQQQLLLLVVVVVPQTTKLSAGVSRTDYISAGHGYIHSKTGWKDSFKRFYELLSVLSITVLGSASFRDSSPMMTGENGCLRDL